MTVSDESADCLNTKLREADLLAGFLTGDTPSDAELGALVLQCLSAEELAALAG